MTISLDLLASGQLQGHSAGTAGALLASVPTLVVHLLLGRYVVGGLTAGSVTG